mmetsp:Transcript_22443/g.39703  ORF Transcript_22443/g.39703 Transcript_22443/m.39703 type:complete len:298 (-) Transcript_22443:69-962(-)
MATGTTLLLAPLFALLVHPTASAPPPRVGRTGVRIQPSYLRGIGLRRMQMPVTNGAARERDVWLGLRGRARHVPFARDPQIPDAIVQAEANSNKQRPLRFGGYGLFGVYGVAVVLSNLGIIDDALPLKFFDSQPISLGMGAVASLLSSYFISTELDQKEKNIERIWAEVKRRKESGSLGQPSAAQATTTSSKASKSKKRNKKQKKTKGFGDSAPTSPQPTTASATAKDDIPMIGKPEPEQKPGMMDGLVSGMQESMQQANVMAKMQALELNAALEDRGLLPRLNETTNASAAESDDA